MSKKTKFREWLDGENFDCACMAYRVTPSYKPDDVVKAFENLKDKIEAKYKEL